MRAFNERENEIIEKIINLDDDFKYNLPIYKKVNDPFPIIGFEIESSVDKHAGGGILNLSRYTHFGFVVVKNKDKASLLRKIKTYSKWIILLKSSKINPYFIDN